ncbi:MAG TPA: hypothetical protein VIZ29_02790 [Gaiellaceae bacterium]
MTKLQDARELTGQIEGLTRELNSELSKSGVDFDRLVQLADEIAEEADSLAETFGNMNDTLMERIQAASSSSSGSRKAAARS